MITTSLTVLCFDDLQVLVVGNPANTNCMITQRSAPSIPASNFSCLTRLDMNRAKSQVSASTVIPFCDDSVLLQKKIKWKLWFFFITFQSQCCLAVRILHDQLKCMTQNDFKSFLQSTCNTVVVLSLASTQPVPHQIVTTRL